MRCPQLPPDLTWIQQLAIGRSQTNVPIVNKIKPLLLAQMLLKTLCTETPN